MELHPSQLELMKYLRGIQSLEGLSLRQIASETGINNPQTVLHHLQQLENKGYLRRSATDLNNFEILKDPVEDAVYIPRYGFATCGNAGEFRSEGNKEDSVAISTKLFGLTDPENIFAVRAYGDSMLPSIHDGDLVLFRSQKNITASGDIALVLHNEEPKIKTVLKEEKNQFILSSSNKSHKDKVVTKRDELEIAGVAIGVIRSL